MGGYTETEKRAVFLRSYHFSRKQSFSEKIKKSFFRIKKVIRVRLRSAKRLRKVVWFRLKNGLFYSTRTKTRFFRLQTRDARKVWTRKSWGSYGSSWPSCLWQEMHYYDQCFLLEKLFQEDLQLIYLDCNVGQVPNKNQFTARILYSVFFFSSFVLCQLLNQY